MGEDADIVIFDYGTIKDIADFSQPLHPPIGIKWVLIGGRIALEKDKIVNRHLGKAVRII